MLAAALGALAAACSVGLLATAAWLISRSALRPQVLFLVTPAAVVQAFGFGRAVFRYAERLAGHDAALNLLAARRVRAYDALARLAPTGIADYGSGDLIARLVADIDSLADRWLRVRLPYAAAAVAGTGAVALVTALQPEAGLILAATLVVSALAAPAAAIALSRREERNLAPLRGELAAATLALLDGAAELTAFGAAGRALAAVQDKGAQVGRATARSGYGRGAAAAVSVARDRSGAARRGVLRRSRGPRGRPGRGAARGRRAHAAGRARGVRRARAGRAGNPAAARVRRAGSRRCSPGPPRSPSRPRRSRCRRRRTIWPRAASRVGWSAGRAGAARRLLRRPGRVPGRHRRAVRVR